MNIKFEPDEINILGAESSKSARGSDLRDGSVYCFDKEGRIALAVNVALATGRPLLLRGAPGSGKSSLAQNVALTLNWRYYETVITSRTEARDLLYRFDSVHRLADAQANKLNPNDAAYIEPGILWWAFNRESAQERGSDSLPLNLRARDPYNPEGDSGKKAEIQTNPAVVLIDEIDKAEIDVPDNLLVPLGSLQFTVDHIGETVKCRSGQTPLIIITTNEEREVSSAFKRRCVSLTLPAPDENRLMDIAKAHLPGASEDLLKQLAKVIAGQAIAAQKDNQQPPSTAEYIDTVRACIELGINCDPESSQFQSLLNITLKKQMDS